MIMKTDILLLIVDMQNDFCNRGGALYVNGAEKDVARLAKFVSANSDKIDHIVLTQDNHHVVDISHPVFWEDANGNPPAPFTEINPLNLAQGIWRPRFEREKAIRYVHDLEQQGEFPHVVWPEHCIIGSSGAAIVDEIMEPVKNWARKGHYYDLIIKGTNPLTEHFGALMANVPIGGYPETQLNTKLVSTLLKYKTILIAGEAKSHCVATTVKQMLNIDAIARKIVILEDCMSVVTGFENLASSIYEKAKKEGALFLLSTEWSR